MTFDDGAQIDPGRVSVGGSGGPGPGGKLALGGGAGGLVVLVLALLFGGDPSSLLGGDNSASTAAPTQSLAQCRTGADANANVDCRVAFTAASLDSVWTGQLPAQGGPGYQAPAVHLFTGSASTGCGYATSDVGPFYCPVDATAYFDTAFFDELVQRFGSSAGPLAQEYVVAHEFGHHIQDELGDIDRAQRDPKGATSASVRTELQADCYAGVWAHFADKTPAPHSDRPFLKPLSDTDVADALSAAAAVGDDRIQRAATGRVNPEGWTHGSSQERQRWFLSGYRAGQLAACDTFTARNLDAPPA